ncbi:hypothetical protein [Spirosoma telluris]|uniref:hypothetical protein n=1 Tax=Spirosoma telluris TaxID=2183553 RepID=UPI0018DB04A6
MMASILLYLDPGSGSMLVQALIASFLTIGVFFNQIKYAVLGLFGKKRPEEEEVTND